MHEVVDIVQCHTLSHDHPWHIKSNRDDAVNCGPPSSPPNGYINPYTSTVEGGRVTFACQNIHQKSPIEEVHTAVCNPNGNWEPDPVKLCSSMWSL